MGMPSLACVCWVRLPPSVPRRCPRVEQHVRAVGDRSGGRAPAGTVRAPQLGWHPKPRPQAPCVGLAAFTH